MKRVLLVATMAVVLVSLMAGTALAGGWWDSGSNPWNDDGSAVGKTRTSANYQQGGWNAAEAAGYGVLGAYRDADGRATPHAGFSATSNNCKTCHAVHNADDDSWRLLRGRTQVATQVETGFWSNGYAQTDFPDGLNTSYTVGTDYGPGSGYDAYNPDGAGSARVGECDVCHLGTGSLTYKRQYKLKAASVRAEHTLGATVIPDATATTAVPGYGETKGLQCYTCHTVHGADRLGQSWGDNAWSNKILRNDPNRDTLGADGVGGATRGETGANGAALRQGDVSGMSGDSTMGIAFTRSTYCGDCHNKNWRNPLDAGASADNHAAHPTWSDDNNANTMEVYGVDVQVAFTSLTNSPGGIDSPLAASKFGGCRACHRVSSQYSGSNSGPSIWPHQGVGFKFLTDSYTDQDGLLDKGGNVIPSNEGFDGVCLACHRKADLSAGVGTTF